MNKKAAFHILILLGATLITFFWISNDITANYSLQLTGILLLTLIISHRLLKSSGFQLVESTVSTIAVLLVTTASGGLSSPLFFLNFILLFELSLLLEPVIPIVLSLILILFYFYSHQVGSSPFALLVLFSFPLMTPLAYFFGKIYKKSKNQKKEIKNLSKKIEKLEEELIEEELGSKP